MKKLVLLFFAIILSVNINYGQVIFSEDFNYTVGSLLTANGWTVSSGGGTNALAVVSPSLTMTNYWANAGGACNLVNTGEDDFKTFTPQTAGSVYLSFIMKVASAQVGDYFIAMSPATQTNYAARTFIKSNGAGGFNIGIGKSNETPTYGTSAFAFATNYLVVIKYTFNTGSTTDDVITVYVLPSITPGMTEPSTAEITYLCADQSKLDPATLESVTLRQGNSSNAPSLTIDGVRISSAWNNGVVGVEKEANLIPNTYSLDQNYPNPFNPSTQISFSVPEAGFYNLKVYDILGKEVATLVNEELSAGKYRVDFNASNLASGTYIYSLKGNNVNLSHKMLLVK